MKATYKQNIILLHDVAIIPISWLGAYWLRFNLSHIPEYFWDAALKMLPVVMLIQIPIFLFYSVHRGFWRFSSVSDLVRIVKSSLYGAAIILGVVFTIWRLEGVPRSVVPLYTILLVGLMSTPRLLYRWFSDNRGWLKGADKKVLIIGAGKAADILLRDILTSERRSFFPVGIVDDDTRKRNSEIHGIRVIGTIDDIPRIVAETETDTAILAIPSANTSQMKHIVEKCEESQITMRTLPRISDIVSGDVSINTLKNVAIEDLLGRDTVELDWSSIKKAISGKKILITGGGGSIGSELSRQIANMGPDKLIIVDNGEYNLYRIDYELKQDIPSLNVSSMLIDVTDIDRVRKLFADEKPDMVFHAAAYKHVPLLENQAVVAARNNVIGTKNIADISGETDVDTFVLVSTDKAVNPTNIMGTTKRVAEMYCQALNQESDTRFITVRFGNVLGSAGSVIPLFRKQISDGGPVTVTHKDITRYFMTIPEASQLIMQSSVLGKGGEIFVLDMGDPIKISYLAEQMIILSGKIPGEDIEIRYSGLRPGEKLYEELFYSSEGHEKTTHDKIYHAVTGGCDKKQIDTYIIEIYECVQKQDEKSLIKLLRKIVPENKIADTGYD